MSRAVGAVCRAAVAVLVTVISVPAALVLALGVALVVPGVLRLVGVVTAVPA